MPYSIEALAKEGFSGHLDLVLLASLRQEEMHGYALIERMREASGGRLDYAEGTIYPALRRLEDEGLVRSRWREGDGRRRRVYALTARGARALAAQQADWNSYVRSIKALPSTALMQIGRAHV